MHKADPSLGSPFAKHPSVFHHCNHRTLRKHHGLPVASHMSLGGTQITSAYRRLLRTSLHSVRFATPARHLIRTILRDSFRNSPEAAFNSRRVERTIKFLEQAGEHNGFQHKILKNILHVRWWRDHRKEMKLPDSLKVNTDVAMDIRQNVVSGAQFDATLTLFNESMDLCLRI